MAAGISNAKARRSSKTRVGINRAKANLPAKAGKRRPPHIKSVKDKHGRRDWVAA